MGYLTLRFFGARYYTRPSELVLHRVGSLTQAVSDKLKPPVAPPYGKELIAMSGNC